ncbi:MAG: DUF2177 family protein [Gemmatimonadales bacterium]
MPRSLRVFLTSLVAFFALDLVWLGLVAADFYQRQLAALLRPDVLWLPAVLFYLVYLVALTALVTLPAVERGSVGRAAWSGALFGLAAYSAFDLTGLALLRDFPVAVVAVDLAWGTTLSAVVASVGARVGLGR